MCNTLPAIAVPTEVVTAEAKVILASGSPTKAMNFLLGSHWEVLPDAEFGPEQRRWELVPARLCGRLVDMAVQAPTIRANEARTLTEAVMTLEITDPDAADWQSLTEVIPHFAFHQAILWRRSQQRAVEIGGSGDELEDVREALECLAESEGDASQAAGLAVHPPDHGRFAGAGASA